MAGVEGIKDKVAPPEPVGEHLYDLPPDEAAAVQQVRDRSGRCLTPLRRTMTTCSKAGACTPDLIETWIDCKRSSDLDPVRLRPHPHAFLLHFGG